MVAKLFVARGATHDLDAMVELRRWLSNFRAQKFFKSSNQAKALG
jgi:hypothetical protein